MCPHVLKKADVALEFLKEEHDEKLKLIALQQEAARGKKAAYDVKRAAGEAKRAAYEAKRDYYHEKRMKLCMDL